MDQLISLLDLKEFTENNLSILVLSKSQEELKFYFSKMIQSVSRTDLDYRAGLTDLSLVINSHYFLFRLLKSPEDCYKFSGLQLSNAVFLNDYSEEMIMLIKTKLRSPFEHKLNFNLYFKKE